MQEDIQADLTSASLTAESLAKALHRAYSLGQTYWQQADSESYKQHAKAGETRARFDQLVAETLTAYRDGIQP